MKKSFDRIESDMSLQRQIWQVLPILMECIDDHTVSLNNGKAMQSMIEFKSKLQKSVDNYGDTVIETGESANRVNTAQFPPLNRVNNLAGSTN